MNIDGVGSGALLQRAGRISRTVDLTISDRGVSRTRPSPDLRRTEKTEVEQVTSSRELQALLSPEETRALKESFSFSGTARPTEKKDIATYGILGTRRANRTTPSLGRLVDFTG